MPKNCEILKVLRPGSKKPLLDELVSIGLKNRSSPPLTTYDIFLDGIDRLRDFKVYPDDVFLCGFMRSGTTMTQEMVWLIVNDFDFERATTVNRSDRFPFFEGYTNRQQICGNTNYTELEDLPRPRTFKIHSSVQFLPSQIHEVKPKIIYISRDVKDVLPSMFYYLRDAFNERQVTFEEFFEKFLSDEVLFTPYREHCAGYWTLEYENILHLTYEWVHDNVEEAILRVAGFLGKEVTKENLERLKEHLAIDSMKKNAACNNSEWTKKLNEAFGTSDAKVEGHIRKGRVGDHKELTPEMAARLDEWMSETLKIARRC